MCSFEIDCFNHFHSLFLVAYYAGALEQCSAHVSPPPFVVTHVYTQLFSFYLFYLHLIFCLELEQRLPSM